MVLSPSSAAQGQAPAEWLRAVGRWLHLGRKGVIVMIRAAQLPQLRPLLLALEDMDEATTVTTQAADLADCEPGSLVLLVVRESDLDWLNLNRPLFSQRSLRVVLWVEAPLSERLKFESPDLHDWISHFVTCPPGVPAFAVEGLRIGSSWWPGVAWEGPGLDLALEQLGIEARVLRPDQPFEELVTTLRADLRQPLLWEGVDSLKKLWRVRWAVAEARHRGLSILHEARVSTPGWFPVSSLQVPVDRLLVPSQQRIAEAIQVELEHDPVVERSLQEQKSSRLERVGLLLEVGRELREGHGSREVNAWRTELVRSIRKQPNQGWSRRHVAIFASLERDRKVWPSFESGVSQRFGLEHVLRAISGKTRSSTDLLAIPPAHFNDVELVRRWGQEDEPVVRGVLEMGERLWASQEGTLDGISADAVFDLAISVGWDPPRLLRDVAVVAETLIDEAGAATKFLSEVIEAATRDLGEFGAALGGYYRIQALVMGLTGDPEGGRSKLEELVSERPASQSAEVDDATLSALAGRLSRAATFFGQMEEPPPRALRLYIATLMAMGEPAQARSELVRLIGVDQDPRAYLGEDNNPAELARALLLERLRSF